MAFQRFLAHIAKDGREQTLREHLAGTATLAKNFASDFEAEELAELCGLSHDFGKYSVEFQERLRGSNKKVDHSTAGSQDLWALGQIQAAFCVAGHHGGLPDGGNRRDNGDEPTFLGRIKKQVKKYDAWKNEISLPNVSPPEDRDPISDAMFTRMLYSCLVDADFLDTERFMAGGSVARPQGEPLLALKVKLDDYIAKREFLQPVRDVNQLRAEVLRACISGGELPSGLFSLTVPTGGGKTISSLAFALNHAVAHGMRRVIYVIPYCSIIDQTAAEFRRIFGDENVLEHHSGAIYETGEDGFYSQESNMALATENWDMPIVVTTSVQFFESLYANRSSQCRKLHSIANSVVIFDEAQMLPLPCLKPCVSAIGQLAEHFRVSAVLCTATQPALDGLFQQLFPGLKRQELCPDTKTLYEALKRVTFRQAGKLSNEELAKRLGAHKQVLCIVNSRSQAQEIYSKLGGEGNIHLSTLMIPKRRAALIAEIRQRLDDGRTCRVVSTSLIEAGVDVDFPVVYRAEAGLDSILQAAGRCNREGLRPAGESIVTVFQSETPAPPIFGASIGAMREVLPSYSDIGSPEAVKAYFTSLLSLKSEDALDKYSVLDAFERELDGCLFPFRKVAERFHLIDSAAKTVYIPVEEGAKLVAEMKKGEVSRGLFRKLGQFGVTVYPNHFNALLLAGDAERCGEDAAILTNPGLYSDETGLSLRAEEGKGLFI